MYFAHMPSFANLDSPLQGNCNTDATNI